LQSDSSTAAQFFKEERTDDAVYNVYLKKVQYSTRVSLLATVILPRTSTIRSQVRLYLFARCCKSAGRGAYGEAFQLGLQNHLIKFVAVDTTRLVTGAEQQWRRLLVLKAEVALAL